MAFELEEEWAPIEGFPNYIVSTFGNILNIKLGRDLHGRKSTYGFLRVNLSNNGVQKEFYLHHLVAKTFLSGYSEGVHVRFKDGDKTNCRIDNLRFANGRGVGLLKRERWSGHGGRRFVLMSLGEEVQSFRNVRTLAEFIQSDTSTVYKVLRGERDHVKGYTVATVDE